MPKTYHCSFEVRGYELDSFGHVNNAVYLQYLEHARWKMLAEEEITLPKLNEWKRWPVISHVEIDYRKPLFMGDLIDIETQITGFRNASFFLSQKIFRAGVLVSDARLTSVIIDENGRPIGVPAPFRKLGTLEVKE